MAEVRLKIVHFSDLHLDAPFAWLGKSPKLAHERRLALRKTLDRVIELTIDEHADALFCGGDLYEHERADPDTGAFLRGAFARLGTIPVYISPGNHDWYGPTSLYKEVNWSSNVHIFTEDSLRPVQLFEGVWLHGAAHCQPAGTKNFLAGFTAVTRGINLALFHGSLDFPLYHQEPDKQQHAPFSNAELENAGLRFAFLGHYHNPGSSGFHAYPGNPDPLAFGDSGEGGALVWEMADDGVVSQRIEKVNQTTLKEVSLDVTGCDTVHALHGKIKDCVAGNPSEAFLRITLKGSLEASANYNLAQLQNEAGARTLLRDGGVFMNYDLAALANEPSVKGEFVRDVQADSSLDETERNRILTAGLRALDGRTDLDVVPQ